MAKPGRNHVEALFAGADDDLAWLNQAAEAMGCDPASYLRMTVRQQRLGRLQQLTFGTVAVSRALTPAGYNGTGYAQPIPEPQTLVAPFVHQNDPVPDFEFPPEQSTPQSVTPETNDDLGHDLQASVSLVDQMLAAPPVPAPRAPSTLRRNANALRSSTRGSVVPFPGDPTQPGAMTRPIGVGQVEDERMLPGAQRVMRQNNAHFFGR